MQRLVLQEEIICYFSDDKWKVMMAFFECCSFESFNIYKAKDYFQHSVDDTDIGFRGFVQKTSIGMESSGVVL